MTTAVNSTHLAMKRHLTRVTADGWSSSCCTSTDGTVATPTRHFKGTGKWLKPTLYGKRFPDSEAAFSAMDAQGMTEIFYPRSSTVLPLFAKLVSQRRQCRFDALYRLQRHLRRQGVRRPDVDERVLRLARLVGIFHHCAAPVLKEAEIIKRDGRIPSSLQVWSECRR